MKLFHKRISLESQDNRSITTEMSILKSMEVPLKRRVLLFISPYVKKARATAHTITHQVIPSILQNAMFFGGFAAITYGVYSIYRPLGPIFSGIVLVWLGSNLMVSREEDRESQEAGAKSSPSSRKPPVPGWKRGA